MELSVDKFIDCNSPGPRHLQRPGEDRGGGPPCRGVRPRACQVLRPGNRNQSQYQSQLTPLYSVPPGYQVGAQAGARAGVCGRPEGNLRPVQDEPAQGEETRHQEVVLRSLPGVRSLLTRPDNFLQNNSIIYETHFIVGDGLEKLYQ